MIPIGALGAGFALGGGPSLWAGRFARLAIAGATETLSDFRGRIEGHAARIKLQVPSTIDEEMRVAVKRIKVRNPVLTGAMRDDWQVQGTGWEVSVVNGTKEPPASYSAFVHKKGEKGRLFVEHYALPEIARARARALRRLRQLLADVAKPVPVGPARVPGGRMR